ncbi:MAG: OmpH family outer membrane protein [Bacteroidota bacterium]|nr:OmpH family outer membrane protein [Bacteroidota bacterium]
MRTKHYLLWIVLILVTGNIAISIWQAQSMPTVVYVRSNDLVYGYFGMKEAKSVFEEKQKQWRAELDTLGADLERTVAKANDMHRSGRMEELEELKPILHRQQNDMARYREAIEKRSNEEEERILSGVLAQVNGFVEQYSKTHDFDLVLGTTDAGSLLYAEEAMDVTEDLLVELNKHHSGSTQ